MDHGGEVTTVGSAELAMAGAVQGSEVNIIGSGTFDDQLAAPLGSFTHFDLSAVAGRAVVPLDAEFHPHRAPGPGVAYSNIGASWRQQGPVNVVLVGPQLPGGVVPVQNNYGYSARLGVGRGEELPDGVVVVFDGIAGALRGPNLGEGYDNRGVVGEHLRRLLPFAGIGACSVAVNGLAAGPGSPAVAFHLFVLLLGGLFLVMLHVLRVRV